MNSKVTEFIRRKIKPRENNDGSLRYIRFRIIPVYFLVLSLLLLPGSLFSQGNFGFGTTSPDASALVDMSSTTQGLLAPRMSTAQRDAIATPATGLWIYNTSADQFQYYNGGNWVTVVGSLSDAWQLDGNAPSAAWDGTSGSYLGTSNTRPLVIATTDAAGQPIQFWTGNAERMRLDGDGKLAIGKTSAGAFVDIEQPNTTTLGQGNAFSVVRDNDGSVIAPNAPVVRIVQDNNADENTALYVKQDGVPTASSGIELPAIYGQVNASTTEQAIGLWGDATGGAGTIGVLATGNGSSNVSLQLNDGSLAMGRSETDPDPNGNAVEYADAGTDYTSNGPSGVVEFTLGSSGNLVTSNPTTDELQDLGTKTIKNSFVSGTSIILVNIVSKSDDGSGADPTNAFFLLDVESRTTGSFSLHFGMIPAETVSQNYDGDSIRIGYLVINPSK